MLVTIGLFVLFLSFAIAVALFWWFLTQVLPWPVLLYVILLVLRCLLAASEKAS